MSADTVIYMSLILALAFVSAFFFARKVSHLLDSKLKVRKATQYFVTGFSFVGCSVFLLVVIALIAGHFWSFSR